MYPQQLQGFHPSDISTFQAKWLCPVKQCSAVNDFVNASWAHPIGKMKCKTCNTIIHSDISIPLRIKNPNLRQLEGTIYKISVPSLLPEGIAPSTVLVWSCCICGESHLVLPTGKQTGLPPRPKSLVERAKSFRKSGSNHVQPNGGESPRYLLNVNFNGAPCTLPCEHKACGGCFRLAQCTSDEWLVRDEDEVVEHRLHLAHEEFERNQRTFEERRKRATDEAYRMLCGE